MTEMEKYIAEFNQLFEELTGIKPENATKGDDGFYFIPPETKFDEKDHNKRKRLSYLSGPNGWRNHLINDNYAGWWVLSPMWNTKLSTEAGIKDFENYLLSM